MLGLQFKHDDCQNAKRTFIQALDYKTAKHYLQAPTNKKLLAITVILVI
jgi:hypothetical protein